MEDVTPKVTTAGGNGDGPQLLSTLTQKWTIAVMHSLIARNSHISGPTLTSRDLGDRREHTEYRRAVAILATGAIIRQMWSPSFCLLPIWLLRRVGFATPACAVESTSGDLHSSSALPQAERYPEDCLSWGDSSPPTIGEARELFSLPIRNRKLFSAEWLILLIWKLKHNVKSSRRESDGGNSSYSD